VQKTEVFKHKMEKENKTPEEELKELIPVITKEEIKKESPRSDREAERRAESLSRWKPKTKLGAAVREGKIKNIDEIFEQGTKIMETEIVDTLLNLQTDFLLIGQAKGKFGGGKRRIWRQTQKKTAEGNVPKFSCMAVVGDGNGHIGVGLGKARETLPSREKAVKQAKLNMIRIKRGCGSFECGCSENHSIPFMTEGKVGSCRIKLIPAPKGTGLAIEDQCKKLFRLAGIKDIYSRTFGQTRTKINLIKACFDALRKTREIKK